MEDVPILVCTDGALEGLTVRVPESGLRIGRSEENDIVIEEDGVSRFHAKLQFDNGSLWLRDVGSRNGMFVNGERVTGHRALKVGDEVSISEHTFSIRWQGDALDEDAPTEEIPLDSEGRRRWFWPFSS